MKNRTIIGIICIVLALVVTFAVAPLVNKIADYRTDIVRLTGDVVQGHMISDTDIEVVTVGSYNLPTDVITKKEDVLGKFAAVDLKKGDYLLPSKVTSVSDSADDVFRTLDGTKQAISVTIQSFAGGLSGKLENGDIVQLAVYDNDTGKAILPGAFTYMKVITTTTDGGFDKDEVPVNDDGTVELPSTITLLANSAQIKLLVEYENCLYNYQIDKNTVENGTFVIEGHFDKPNIMSDSLRQRLIQYGVPQNELNRFLMKGVESEWL